MPEIQELTNSDDEYQDAVSSDNDATAQKSSSVDANSNASIVDEIIKQQNDLHLYEECDDSTQASTSGAADGGDENVPEYAHDDIDEEAMKEKEKSMTHEELEANKEKAQQMKLKANELFKNNEAEQAIDIYTEALGICPTTYTKDRAVLYGNRAAAKIKIENKKPAIEDCTKAIELWPEYVRALLRRAKLYEHEDKLDEALADYKRVYELDPGQNEAREAMLRLPPIVEERNERLKAEMMDKLKDIGNMILKPFGLSTSNFQMQKDPNTGSYSINFNQNAS
ncbi:tetratricopeptide repeat protein 1 [Stomoxys calcitrans]|uniref:tetratricopeptide repeat protein 1 n=1 Tax=Stomoxys calcitrans TaxID=35570 RepID=UPI0027E24F2A|nr:tetratricopeptide repeat protein 1 [Stomoxys calcitrans]